MDKNDLEDHRREIETLLASLENSAPAILRSLDEATKTARATIEAVDAALSSPPTSRPLGDGGEPCRDDEAHAGFSGEVRGGTRGGSAI